MKPEPAMCPEDAAHFAAVAALQDGRRDLMDEIERVSEAASRHAQRAADAREALDAARGRYQSLLDAYVAGEATDDELAEALRVREDAERGHTQVQDVRRALQARMEALREQQRSFGARVQQAYRMDASGWLQEVEPGLRASLQAVAQDYLVAQVVAGETLAAAQFAIEQVVLSMDKPVIERSRIAKRRLEQGG